MTFPGANRTAQWFYDDVGGASMGPVEKVVWHTTEGNGWPGYDGGRKAPHYTVLPDFGAKRMLWRAHFPDGVNARAMRNEAGGVQTNLDGALQVEIVGTCDQTPSAPSWTKGARVLRSWDLTDWQAAGLAEFVAWAQRQHGVPLAAPSTWLAYGVDPRAPGRVPASYGRSPARMTGKVWDGFRGHCGHQHAPENDHGDPGRLPIADIFTRARRLLEPDDDLIGDLVADPKERAALIADTAKAVLTTPQPLYPYVDGQYKDPDDKMSLSELVQHAAGQAFAANGTAGAAAAAAGRAESGVAQVNARLDAIEATLADIRAALPPAAG